MKHTCQLYCLICAGIQKKKTDSEVSLGAVSFVHLVTKQFYHSFKLFLLFVKLQCHNGKNIYWYLNGFTFTGKCPLSTLKKSEIFSF